MIPRVNVRSGVGIGECRKVGFKPANEVCRALYSIGCLVTAALCEVALSKFRSQSGAKLGDIAEFGVRNGEWRVHFVTFHVV